MLESANKAIFADKLESNLQESALGCDIAALGADIEAPAISLPLNQGGNQRGVDALPSRTFVSEEAAKIKTAVTDSIKIIVRALMLDKAVGDGLAVKKGIVAEIAHSELILELLDIGIAAQVGDKPGILLINRHKFDLGFGMTRVQLVPIQVKEPFMPALEQKVCHWGISFNSTENAWRAYLRPRLM